VRPPRARNLPDPHTSGSNLLLGRPLPSGGALEATSSFPHTSHARAEIRSAGCGRCAATLSTGRRKFPPDRLKESLRWWRIWFVMTLAVNITLSDEERLVLERRAAKLTLPYRDVQRARVILYAAEGLSNVEIARRLEMCSKVVGQWRRRFRVHRLDGLHDQPRSGRPRRFPPARGRAGQGDRVRVAQGARATAVAVQPL